MTNSSEQNNTPPAVEEAAVKVAAETIETLHELARSAQTDQQPVMPAVAESSDSILTCAEIPYVRDLPTLTALLGQRGAIAEAAALQYHKLLAGNIVSEMEEKERLRIIESLDSKSLKQIALMTKRKDAGAAAVGLITDSQDLADVCLFAASVFVRKSAAEKIVDVELIRELLDKITGKDKTVEKVLSGQLTTGEEVDALSTENHTAKASKPRKDEPPQQNLVELVKPEYLELASTLQSPIAPAQLENLKAINSTLRDSLVQARKQIASSESSAAIDFLKLLLALDGIEKLETEITGLAAQLKGLSHKDSSLIRRLHNQAQKIRDRLQWPASLPAAESYSGFLQTVAQLEGIVAKNTNYQTQLHKTTNALIDTLKEALEQGNSAEADQCWTRIQSNIKNCDGDIQRELQQRSLEFKAKLDELRGWKNFAATQKKNELIAQMQHLITVTMTPPAKVKSINNLHKEWKLLGKTSENEKLWRQFKKSSDEAYEPCKEYFKQQKEKLAHNFQQRKEICSQLETFLASLAESGIDLNDLIKIETKARDDWKLYAPVEHSKIKKLQKHYYGLMESIRKHKHDIMQDNARRKESLTQQAVELIAAEDIRFAMDKARALQAEWKTIGTSSFKDDRKYWEAFRGACDQIFAKRDVQKTERRSEISSSLNEIEKSLVGLASILEKDETEFRESRNQFSTLQREFHNAMIPAIKKERDSLKSRFDGLVRKIELRFKKLPDKKQAKTRTALLDKVAFCEGVERRYLTSQDDSSLAIIKNEINLDDFAALGSCGDPQLDKAISKRLQTVMRMDKLATLHELLQAQAGIAKNIVVELEILANIASPEPDRALRMQVQLNQLKNNFGKSTETRTNSQIARDAELNFLCTGPLEQSTASDLRERLQRAIEKLI